MILPLKQQVPARETCERLQETNFNGGTLLWWAPQPTPENECEWRVSTAPTGGVGIPAPTVAELGALLPRSVGTHHIFGLHVSKCESEWSLGYMWHHRSMCNVKANTEAEARALLWLSLDAQDLLPDAAYGGE